MSLDKKDLEQVHVAIPGLVDQLKEGKLERREFLRMSTLLGLSATAAYALAGLPEPIAPAEAATGGTITFSMRVVKIDNPATFSWVYDSNIVRQVCDYLTRTGADNVTRPWLLEKWKASDDLKTWTLTLKKGIKWSNGDELVADHVVWNISRWLDEKTGSSILGLFSSFMMVVLRHRHEGLRRQGRDGQQALVRHRHPEGGRLHHPAERQAGDAGHAGEPVPLSGPDPASEGERRVRRRLDRHGSPSP